MTARQVAQMIYPGATEMAPREQKRSIVRKLKAGGCAECGERRYACLDFHHLDPVAKHFNIGSATYDETPVDDFFDELADCLVLCSNCHRVHHAGGHLACLT
jgi:hypothetical protein